MIEYPKCQQKKELKMEKNIIAIIADGEIIQDIGKILKDFDIIIAADGGADLCRSQQITPDYIIGDLDSITYENMEFFSEAKFIKITEQNHTDMQIAISYALMINTTKIKIISAFGKRTDHTLSNILIFQNYDESIPLEVYDNFGIMSFYTPGKYELVLQLEQTISFFSLTPIEGLFLQGFKYPVNNSDFSHNFIGVSNVVINQKCTIEFQKGKLISYIITV
jgi:thiamine pyrophosphokinase